MDNVVLKPFDPRTASEAEHAAVNDFSNIVRAETLPDDPPISLTEAVQSGRNMPELMNFTQWVVWNAQRDRVIASADVSFLNVPENSHIVQFHVRVLPEFRRRGLARQLLARLVDVPRRERRRLMIAATNGRVPAGAAWMERIGARRGLETHVNQLRIAEVSRDLVRLWQERAPERAAGFELGFWEGAFPEQDLEAIAQLMEVMNTAPRDSLEVEDYHITPEMIRQFERAWVARGQVHWTMYVREAATGRLAGYTDVFWNPRRPQILYQEDTGVFPEYRNRGLGRWLKATMLEKVLRERAEVRFVRTGNADSNAAMLKINYELGFAPYFSETVWQVETEKVIAYLDR